MNQQLIIALIPTIVALIVYGYHIIWQRIPDRQRAALAQLILPLVQFIKESYAQSTPAQRYAAAVLFINDAFALLNLPAPDAAIVSEFIDFVFGKYGLKQ